MGIGAGALVLNVSGSNNTSVGGALVLTLGSDNTGIGFSAGNINTTGSGNTYIGSSSNGSANNLTLSMAIGAGAIVGASSTMALGGTTVSGKAVDIVAGATTASAKLHLIKTTEQLRLGYDTSNYFSTTVDASGNTAFALTGTSPLFTFSQGIINSTLTASSLVLTDGSKQLISGTAANLATAGIPTVTNVSLTGQVADIGATNLATVAGLYLVSYSLQDTTADLTAGAVVLTISYTDGAGATTATATQLLTAVGRQSGSVYVQLASGNLTYTTTHSGIFGSSVYALYITTERVK